MDPSPKAMIRLLLPRLPLILKTALFNALSISENSAKQNLTTEVAVVVLRSIMSMRRPVRFLQRISTRDPGIKGPIWVSKVTLAPPEDGDGPRDALCAAIAELGSGNELIKCLILLLLKLSGLATEMVSPLQNRDQISRRPNSTES